MIVFRDERAIQAMAPEARLYVPPWTRRPFDCAARREEVDPSDARQLQGAGHRPGECDQERLGAEVAGRSRDVSMEVTDVALSGRADARRQRHDSSFGTRYSGGPHVRR